MGEFVRATRQRPLPPGRAYESADGSPDDWLDEPLNGAANPHWTRLARWLRPGADTSVGGHLISGGMIYLGRRLLAACGGRLEPALIDPDLDLAGWHPETDAEDLGYWPSYDRIPPASRAAYLRWLADGRRAPDVPIGFVFLFFYGLERRLLHDITADPSLRTEIPLLAAEVRGLLEVYGAHASFRRYANEFLNLLELVDAPGAMSSDAFAVPDLRERRWPPPMTLRRALGAFASEGRPLPPAWALAWSWYHPDIALRTPALRCPKEYARLFERRYVDAHGDGLVLLPGQRSLRVEYQPASAGLRRAVYGQPDIPDVFLAETPGRHLAEVVRRVTDDLGSYSRWLRRHPDQGDSLAAAGLLPAALVLGAGGRARHREVAAFQGWVEHHLCGADTATLDADALIAWWPTATAGVLTKREAATLSRLLGHLGVGLEPDVRLGGPAPAAGQSAVLFRIGADAAPLASEAYSAAVTFAQLATALAAGEERADERAGR